MSDKTLKLVIGVVTAIWAGNIVAGMIPAFDYRPSEGVNAIFTLILGGAFAERARKKNGDDGEK